LSVDKKLQNLLYYISLITSVLILLMVFFILFLIGADYFVNEINNETIVSGIISGAGSLFGGVIGAIVALIIVNKQFNNMKQIEKEKSNALVKKCALILKNDLIIIKSKVIEKTEIDIMLTDINFKSWDKIRFEIADLLDVSDFKRCEGLYLTIRETERVKKQIVLDSVESLIQSFDKMIKE